MYQNVYKVSTIYILCAADALSKSSSPMSDPLVWCVKMIEAPAPLRWLAGFCPIMPEWGIELPITLPDMCAGSTNGFSNWDSTKPNLPLDVDITFTAKPTVLTSHFAALLRPHPRSWQNHIKTITITNSTMLCYNNMLL